MNLRLRAARPQDAEALALILDDWIHETAWMPKLHGRAETEGFLQGMIAAQTVLVAWLDAVRAGFLGRKGAEVTALYITREARRQGVGTALLAEAKRQGDLTLWTFAANEGALAFYRREGFKEIARTDGAGNDERLPDIRLAWRN